MAVLTTLSEFKSWLFPEGVSDSFDDGKAQGVIDAASSWIEAQTGRVFGLDTANVTKVYYPDLDGDVTVLDLVTVASIKLDSNGDRSFATTLATTDYELLPQNAPRYSRVRIWPTSSKSFAQRRLVQVVGKFGYVENGRIPPPVVTACKVQAARLFERKNAPFGVLTNAEIGRFETLRELDPDVAALLAPYKVGGSVPNAWVLV